MAATLDGRVEASGAVFEAKFMLMKRRRFVQFLCSAVENILRLRSCNASARWTPQSALEH